MSNWNKFPENKPKAEKLLWAFSSNHKIKLMTWTALFGTEAQFINYGLDREYASYDNDILYWMYCEEPAPPVLTPEEEEIILTKRQREQNEKEERIRSNWILYVKEMQEMDSSITEEQLQSDPNNNRNFMAWLVNREMNDLIMKSFNGQ
jgi:hypothetical protein